MLEGLWTVEFRSSIGNTGYGTVTFDGKKARGGTAGYYYVGNYQIEAGVMNVLLRVRRFNTGLVSVFGPLEEFEVQLSGSVNGAEDDNVRACGRSSCPEGSHSLHEAGGRIVIRLRGVLTGRLSSSAHTSLWMAFHDEFEEPRSLFGTSRRPNVWHTL
jgi:hypothetical protein